MADISNLANLQAGEPLDWDGYKDSQEAPPPPPKGRYTVRAPEQITFSATQQGFLSAQVDPTIVGPTAEGYVIKFSRVSAKPFKRGQVTVSQLGDYLRACGITSRPTTPQEQANAVEQTAGRVYQIEGDWEAYDSETKWTLKGMENFPDDGKGGKSPWVKVPGTGSETEPAKTIRANFRVSRYVPQT